MTVPDPETIEDSFLKFLGLSRDGYRDVYASGLEREARAPDIGSKAPDFVAERLTGSGRRTGNYIRLSELRGRPVALVFGSYTCPPFRGEISPLTEVYERHRDQAEFFLVYIQEAHPDDGWQMEINHDDKIVYNQPRTDTERGDIAKDFVQNLAIDIPVLLDSVSNTIDGLYAAVPSKLYVIDADGRIAYRSGPGPWEFDVNAWDAAIGEQLGLS